MDDLLYTLFVIAWIAYGIYKGVKKSDKTKKKLISSGNNVNESRKGTKFDSAFESVFNEVFDLPSSGNDKIGHPYGKEIEEKQTKKAPFYENYAEKEVLDSYKGTDNIISVFEDASEEIVEDNRSNKMFDNQEEEGYDDDRNTVFDLRQAVIHQVILERPY